MQLDFDLHGPPPKPPEPTIHSVTELTRRIRTLLEKGIGQVWVEGEISNLRKQASGHQYFTLKDDGCQLPCVLFSRAAAAMPALKLADGLHVQISGELSVYEPRGQYQLIARLVQGKGAGALQARFEALKRQLADEGLFDPSRKRPLPRFPRRAGLVTSPTGAAIRDFLHVLHRRHPGIEVLINPVRVQGRGASLEIARAIGEFSEAAKHGLPEVDVIVVTRGGGSIEDLWEFNEEVVARAIAASQVPVVSAVGHEIDFTIADFVADLRAPTPSAAAEILAADREEVLARLRQHFLRLNRAGLGRLELLEMRLEAVRQSPLFRESMRRALELTQTLDRHADRLHHHAKLSLERGKSRLDHLSARLTGHDPSPAIADKKLRFQFLERQMTELASRQLTARQTALQRIAGMLHTLDPNATLARGYTMTTDAAGQPLTSVHQVRPGMVLRTRFSDGEAESIAAKR